jgi:hypothetical protein
MEPNLDIKQAFLRQEIIDKNYETDEFVQFFQESTGLLDFDLDRIKYSDLKKVKTI